MLRSRAASGAIHSIVAGLALLPVAPAKADTGDNRVQFGIAGLMPLNSQHRVRTAVVPTPGTVLAGIPEHFDSPGAETDPQGVSTLALTLGRRLAAHWAIELDLGAPPVIEAEGRGTISVPTRLGSQLPIDLAEPALNPLGSARQWAPALQLQYRFRADCLSLCPFLGLGATYSWFTRERLNPVFEQRLNEQYGANLARLAGKPGPTTARFELRPTLRPVFAAGLSHGFDAHWSMVVVAAYVPFATQAELRLIADDGSTLSTTRNRVGVDALVSSLLFGYRW